MLVNPTACASVAAFPRTVKAGGGSVIASQMRPTPPDSSVDILRSNFENDGYLYVKGYLDRRDVLKARQRILSDMRGNGFVGSHHGADLASQADILELERDGQGPQLLNRQELARAEPVLNVLEHPKLFELLEAVFSPCASAGCDGETRRKATKSAASPLTIRAHPYKWLRAVPPGQNTGPHIDKVYFPHLQTIWLPLDDIQTSLGSLLLVPGSHTSPAFSHLHGTYGNSSVGKDGTVSGYLCADPNEIASKFNVTDSTALHWVTDDMEMGDVILVNNRTIHCSATNVSAPPRWRISCDTRWFVSESREP
ncbi:uncharacterized protein EV422DRAFT_417266 [Fimicolochytrium jonesii]|uniref:uncharacterized protein n=1 Tax=Fimicolochytrium jonesii TaxID=1396493 RepID=UPI0022FE3104|nr:uncharacterized protein EV422DRAFT_417266 [Fimicolochytrium jonesii]KAI8822107.1 hypothetical protein EV422DRAFT_417266 [Fimicolochytrium jonesii]